MTRAPLIHRLGMEPRVRITLVEAPRGYGKTLFLQEWEDTIRRRGIRTALLPGTRLAASERSLIEMVAQALSLRGATEEITSFSELLAAISIFSRTLVFFIDDIEELGGEVLSRLTALIDNASDKVRFVLAFAPPCPIPVGRHAAAGGLTRVTSEDLLFGIEDARQFLPEDCTEEDALELHSLTGGWPLALSVLSGAEDQVESGIEVLRAMIGQLLERQSAAVRELLITMSITPAFSNQHAAFLMERADAHLLIGEARRSGFPLIYEARTDSYRFHGVVRDFLRDTLQQDDRIDERRMHVRSAHWHIMRNEPLEALRHALPAGDYALTDSVTRLQGNDWPMGLIKGMSGLKELSALPLASLTRAPRLWIAVIYGLIQNGELAAADAQMRLLRASSITADPVFYAERDAMSILLRHYRDEPILDSEVTPLIERCETMRTPPVTTTLIQYNLPMFAAVDAADLVRAQHFGEAACMRYQEQGAILADVYTRLRLGQTMLRQGYPAQALEQYRHVHSETTQHLLNAPHHLMGRLFIAEVMQHQGNFAKAEAMFDHSLAVIDRMEPWPPLVEAYYRVRARSTLWHGERGRAIAILDEGRERAHHIGAPRVLLSLGLARAEIIGTIDMIDHVDSTLAALSDQPQGTAVFAPWLWFQGRLARARLTLRIDPTDSAAQLVRLASEAHDRGLTLLAHSASLLSGLVHVAVRQLPQNAIDAILSDQRDALLAGLVMEEIWLSGDALRSLPAGAETLERVLGLIGHHQKNESIARNRGVAAGPVAATLSPRERDVLDLMLLGLSGSEMASRLNLSESSIKSYRNALYRKFGVRQRSALIAAVREFGLSARRHLRWPGADNYDGR
ncbi:helix-turn-helix transcriptional regulator [Sphingobium aquiterrae]|uniref:helix-turn-helix transcriptional regulator n=1 Tax=Sphingobium aquiterrae TaxID=2038656 RepID=UPI00301A30A6